jgi:hypothetical protein
VANMLRDLGQVSFPSLGSLSYLCRTTEVPALILIFRDPQPFFPTPGGWLIPEGWRGPLCPSATE